MDLTRIERELQDLCTQQARRWQRMAVLLIEVEREKLHLERTQSFTAWVRLQAEAAGVHESMLWRSLKAGRFYCELQQEDPSLEDLGQCPPLDAQALELLEKISRYAAPRQRADLVKRTVRPASVDRDTREAPCPCGAVWKQSGQPKEYGRCCLRKESLSRAELAETWKTYRKLRPADETARGRGEDAASPLKREDLRAADIISVLRSDQAWATMENDSLGSSSVRCELEVPAETGLFDLVAVVGKAVTGSGVPIVLHGVLVASPSDAVGARDLRNFSPFVDRLWVAVPDSVARTRGDLIRSAIPSAVGVLAVRRRDAVVIRAAQPGGSTEKVLETTAHLLSRAYALTKGQGGS